MIELNKMDFLNQIGKYLFVFIIAFIVGCLLFTNNSIMAIILFPGFIYCFLCSWSQKFILFSLTVFFPLSLSSFGPIKGLKWIEILSPLLCLLLFANTLSERKQFISKKASIFFIAILILIIWTTVSYLKNPVSGQTLFGGGFKEGGMRSYYTIIVGIATFLCSYWFFVYKKLNVNKWFILLLIFSLFLGYLKVIGHFKNFDIPFLGGTFSFKQSTFQSHSFYRIGGLSETASLGIIAMIALLYKKKWKPVPIFCLLGFFILIFLSGGRTYFFGIILSAIIYACIINKKYILHLTMLVLLIIISYYICNLANISIPFSNQLDRLLEIKGGLAQQDLYRYNSFAFYWEIFKKYPIFGKGIGYLGNIQISSRYNEFVSQQLLAGGHGSYLSILSTFGIGGIFFLITMLSGSLFFAYKIVNKNKNASLNKYLIEDDDNNRLALFALLYFIILSVVFISGGNGYNNMEMWFLSGMIAGIISKEQKYGRMH